MYVREMSHVRGYQVLCTCAPGMKCVGVGNHIARNVLRTPGGGRGGEGYKYARGGMRGRGRRNTSA